MLIANNLRFHRILKFTWKVDLLMIVACTAVYFLREFIIPESIQIPPTMATLLGTTLAFFIGFNNNQAYARWWEARKIWGALVNDSRSWARGILHFTTEGTLSSGELSEIKRQMILRHISFVYALNDTLRRKAPSVIPEYLQDQEVQRVKQESNVPNAILSLNAIDLQKLSDHNSIDQFRFVQLNQLLTAFTDHMGKSERIRNTVFPTTYIYFTKLFIWVLLVFTTMILTSVVGPWSILIGWVIGFVFHVTHQNGMTLMDPFDEAPSGIPLNQISRTIEINLLQMMGETEVPKPLEPIDGEYFL